MIRRSFFILCVNTSIITNLNVSPHLNLALSLHTWCKTTSRVLWSVQRGGDVNSVLFLPRCWQVNKEAGADQREEVELVTKKCEVSKKRQFVPAFTSTGAQCLQSWCPYTFDTQVCGLLFPSIPLNALIWILIFNPLIHSQAPPGWSSALTGRWSSAGEVCFCFFFFIGSLFFFFLLSSFIFVCHPWNEGSLESAFSGKRIES